MKIKHRSRRTSNHITEVLRHKNSSFWTAETWFCYIRSKICLGITKTELKRPQKTIWMASFLPPGACFMCPWLPQPHQTESKDVQFGNLSRFSLQRWLGPGIHFPVTWFCSCCVPSPPSGTGWILTWNFFLCPQWALVLTCLVLLLLWFQWTWVTARAPLHSLLTISTSLVALSFTPALQTEGFLKACLYELLLLRTWFPPQFDQPALNHTT